MEQLPLESKEGRILVGQPADEVTDGNEREEKWKPADERHQQQRASWDEEVSPCASWERWNQQSWHVAECKAHCSAQSCTQTQSGGSNASHMHRWMFKWRGRNRRSRRWTKSWWDKGHSAAGRSTSDCGNLSGDSESDTEADWTGFLYWPGELVSFHDLVLDPFSGILGGGFGSGLGGTGASGSGHESVAMYTLIFFHACTHGPADVLPYMPNLWRAGLRPNDVRIVAPCAPRRETDDWVTNAWYDYTTDRCWQGSPDCASFDQLVEQRQRLLTILEMEHQRLPPGGRMVLGGLSQGASVALDVLLHAPEHVDSISGCFCTRGMLQRETLWDLPPQKVQQRAAECPVFVFHGTADYTVPWSVAKHSYKWLDEQGFTVSRCTVKGVEHSTESPQEYQRIAEFVAHAFASQFSSQCDR